jgi:hypothetical protein
VLLVREVLTHCVGLPVREGLTVNVLLNVGDTLMVLVTLCDMVPLTVGEGEMV